MSKKNDGGPAFPRAATILYEGHKGMSLRDYFAGQALVGLMASTTTDASTWKKIAELSYEMAGVMLAERSK